MKLRSCLLLPMLLLAIAHCNSIAMAQSSSDPEREISDHIAIGDLPLPLPKGAWQILANQRSRGGGSVFLIPMRSGTVRPAIIKIDLLRISVVLDNGKQLPSFIGNPRADCDSSSSSRLPHPLLASFALPTYGASILPNGAPSLYNCGYVYVGDIPSRMGSELDQIRLGLILAANSHLDLKMEIGGADRALTITSFFVPHLRGLDGSPASYWTKEFIKTDSEMTDYVRRVTEWGKIWHEAIVEAQAGKPTRDVPANP